MAGKMLLEDWLDDLCVRFIINIPEEDLSSVARICFQVEEAQWFYEDFIRPLDPSLPSMSLRIFCLRIFKHCPLLAHFSEENHLKAFEDFLEYKTRIPVRGAIMLNHEMDSTVLVKGWKKGASWTFPAGKINKAEDDLDCAVREVWEETGLDLQAAGLVPPGKKPEYIELPIRGHQVRLYIFRQVPMDYDFQPQTRKEISRIDWYKLSDLPAFRKKNVQSNGSDEKSGGISNNKFYMIAPFMPPLKKWVSSQRRKGQNQGLSLDSVHLQAPALVEEEAPESLQWAQPQNHYQSGVAMETLDGASQELRRLLKMHAPGDGAQPPTQISAADKGSALLSILQAKGSVAPSNVAPAPLQHQLLPHAPSEAVWSHPPQPHNPHHQANQQQLLDTTQQQPPTFPLPNSTITHHQVHYQQQSVHLAQPPIPDSQQPNLHFSARSSVLAHPQPLPPQVQRAVFNQSTFQETSINNTDRITQAAPAQQQPVSFPQQNQPQDKQVPLNGRSQALLDAFKRGPQAQPAVQQPGAQPMKRPSVEVAMPTTQHDHYPQYTAPPPPHFMQSGSYSASTSQQPIQGSPSELAGSRSHPPPNEQKSNLLGLFKKSGPDEQSMRQHQYHQHQNVFLTGQPTASPSSSSSQTEKPTSHNSNPYASADQPAPAAIDKRMEHLAIFSRKEQPHPSAFANSTSPQHRQPPAMYPNQQKPQAHTQSPIRILQRGQNMDSLGSPPVPVMATKPSPSEFQAPPAPNVQANRLPATQTDRRSSGGGDQKRQLLSLFGQKPSPGAGGDRTTIQGGPGITQREGGSASSTKRSENPMSPADQSFLLGYLQSVTTGASKKKD